jgi:AcrR family transcriptional regulator
MPGVATAALKHRASRPTVRAERAVPVRSDVQRNRRKLLETAGRLLRDAPRPLTLDAVAQAAGLSRATAYRHFSSVEDLQTAYLLDVVLALRDYSQRRTTSGPALFDEVLERWGRLLARHGAAMVQLRSRRGFLERLRAGDPVITAVHDAWQRPIEELMAAHHTRADAFPQALMLCNILLDPREILDLIHSGKTMRETLTFLSRAYQAAIQQL